MEWQAFNVYHAASLKYKSNESHVDIYSSYCLMIWLKDKTLMNENGQRLLSHAGGTYSYFVSVSLWLLESLAEKLGDIMYLAFSLYPLLKKMVKMEPRGGLLDRMRHQL